MKQDFKKGLLVNGAAAGVLVVLLLLRRGVFAADSPRAFLVVWADAVGLTAMLLLAVAFIRWSARQGTFDTAAFGMKRIAAGMKKKSDDARKPGYDSYFSYLQARRAERENLPSQKPQFLVALLMLAAAIVLNGAFVLFYG